MLSCCERQSVFPNDAKGERKLKAGIIGNGNVGLAVLHELRRINGLNEIALMGRNGEKVRAEIEDCLDAHVLYPDGGIRLYGGGYELAEGADLLIYTAGTGRTPGQSRLDLVEKNLEITEALFTEIRKYNQDAIVICVTNPVDIITTFVRRLTGWDRRRVIGTGTLLDEARLTRYVASLLDLSPRNVNLFVMGEHGGSACIQWSLSRILGMKFEDYFSMDIRDEQPEIDRQRLLEKMKNTGAQIIRGKGSTSYGVASAVRKIVEAIMGDTHEVMSVSTELCGEYGITGQAVSTPCMIGRGGVLEIKELLLADAEAAALKQSAVTLAEIFAATKYASKCQGNAD